MKRITVVSVVMVAAFVTLSFFFYRKNSELFSCASEADFYVENKYTMHTIVQGFIFGDNTGFTTHRGVVEQGGEKYIVNRDLYFSIYPDKRKNTMYVTYTKIEKKGNDNLPDDKSWSTMYKVGERYYISILRVNGGVYIVRDRGVSIYICSEL